MVILKVELNNLTTRCQDLCLFGLDESPLVINWPHLEQAVKQKPTGLFSKHYIGRRSRIPETCCLDQGDVFVPTAQFSQHCLYHFPSIGSFGLLPIKYWCRLSAI